MLVVRCVLGKFEVGTFHAKEGSPIQAALLELVYWLAVARGPNWPK